MCIRDRQYIDNPTNYPDPAVIAKAEEPMVKAEILTPADFVGNVMELCQNRRGVFVNMQYLDDTRVSLHYVLPLNEIVYDFFDVLKSRTRGYASFDYEVSDYMESKLVKLDVLPVSYTHLAFCLCGVALWILLRVQACLVSCCSRRWKKSASA